MTIAICTDGIYPHTTGGMQKHSRLLIESMAALPAIQLVVLHPHDSMVFNLPNVREIRIPGIDISKNYLLECYRYSKRVAEQLHQLNPEVIYSQGLSVWADASSFRTRLIINPHGLEPYQALGRKHQIIAIPFKWIFRSLFNKAARVVSLGGKLTTILQSQIKSPGKISCIPNAVNLPDQNAVINKTYDQPVKVLFLARFASNKGIDVLFQAIDTLSKKGVLENFKFKLGGKGPLYDYYKARNPYPQVELLGFVADAEIASLYEEADLFVLPTLFEGMPTVVLEAMSYHLPIIVSNVGATSEQVEIANGFLLEPGDSDALVTSLLSFAAMPAEQKRSMGIASYYKVARSFTWDVVAKKHLELFYEVAADAS